MFILSPNNYREVISSYSCNCFSQFLKRGKLVANNVFRLKSTEVNIDTSVCVTQLFSGRSHSARRENDV